MAATNFVHYHRITLDALDWTAITLDHNADNVILLNESESGIIIRLRSDTDDADSEKSLLPLAQEKFPLRSGRVLAAGSALLYARATSGTAPLLVGYLR